MQNRYALLAGVVISAMAFTAYFPALNAGFVWDDWDFVRFLIQLPFVEYLLQYFDPRLQFMWYRPMSGMLWRINYAIFGTNPFGYHLSNLLIHTANCLMLFALVKRVTGNLRIGFVAALLYAGLPLFADAVLWPSDSQVLATLFYLLAIWFWLTYLETERRGTYVVVLLFSLLAIITKETSTTLPVMLFLIDRLLVGKRISVKTLVQRYLPFVLIILLYLGLMYRALTYGVFPNQLGFKARADFVIHLLEYLRLLAFPWQGDRLLTYLWLALVVLAFAWVVLSRSRKRELVWLGSAMVLTMLPVSFLPDLKSRYTYTAAMGSAIFLALVFEMGWRIAKSNWHKAVLAIILALVLITDGWRVGEACLTWAEISRVARVPFRTIAQRHPQFPQDTYLYFIDSWANYLTGMFLARYGAELHVQDVYAPRVAGLSEHKNPIVIYFVQGDPKELAVARDSVVQRFLTPPPQFEVGLVFQGYELVSARLKRGEPLALILYWKTLKKIDKDYTFFVHLVDSNGNIVVGNDSQPRGGAAPTTLWEPNVLTPDGVVMFIPADSVLGDYHLEIGVYYLPTMQRLAVLDTNGQPVSDHVVIESVQIVE